eukprot:gene20891-21622_t
MGIALISLMSISRAASSLFRSSERAGCAELHEFVVDRCDPARNCGPRPKLHERTAVDPLTRDVVTVDHIGHKGDGVADTPDGPLYVPLSLPGEVVRVVRDGDRATIVEILTASPDRVTPGCPHFGTCGGCALQHMAAAAYLEMKRQSVAAALADRGIEVEVLPVAPIAPRSRRRAVIAVQRTPTGSIAGFRERLSHKVADAGQCIVVTEAIRAALPRLQRLAE